MYKEIYDKICSFDTIIIHRHQKPDGDAIGASFGLKYAIEETFPNKKVYVVGDDLGRFSFVGKIDVIEDSLYNDALVFVLDTGARALISDTRYDKGKFLIKIDHHQIQENYGDLSLVQVDRESCCGVIIEFLRVNEFVISTDCASVLFLGMVTDSGRFRYSSTSKTTFENAAFLMQYSPRLEEIYNEIYTESLSSVMLKARYVSKIKQRDSGVGYIYTSKEEIIELGLDPYYISRGMVSCMSGIKEIPVWANFTELSDGRVLCEFRSSGANVFKVASMFGGGGHLQACGATIGSAELIENVLIELDKCGGNNE